MCIHKTWHQTRYYNKQRSCSVEGVAVLPCEMRRLAPGISLGVPEICVCLHSLGLGIILILDMIPMTNS